MSFPVSLLITRNKLRLRDTIMWNVSVTRTSLAQIIAFANPAASHYLSQSWLVISWTPRNIFHLNLIWKSKFFILENAIKNIVCNMSANCLGLEVLTGQVRLWSTFGPSPHLYRRWFMSSIYECDLKRSMCVKMTRTAKVFMPSVTQLWFLNVHHHLLYLRQRWVNVLSLLDHQLCILQLIL